MRKTFSTTHPAPVSEMERSRVTLISLLCVVFFSRSRISGAHVEMRVRPGDVAYLWCDDFGDTMLNTVWFRNSSLLNPSPLMIKIADLSSGDLPRLSAAWNPSTNVHDLVIRNVSKADVGQYYCALYEKKSTTDVYHYGRTATRLSLLEEASPNGTGSPGWCVSWEVLVGVGAGCVLLSSLFSTVCVYYFCRNTTKAEIKADQDRNQRTQQSVKARGDEVCYASINVQKLEVKRKKKEVQKSDLTTYSEVRTTGLGTAHHSLDY